MVLHIEGMACKHCSARVEKAVSKVPGVSACSVSLLTNSMEVDFDPAQTSVEEICRAVASGDMEQAVPLAQDAYTRWQKYRSITAAFADHNPMDDTERLFREMMVYAETDEVPHFAACCTQLSAMLKATYETHGFSLKNIL